jgi:TonB-dependent receptor
MQNTRKLFGRLIIFSKTKSISVVLLIAVICSINLSAQSKLAISGKVTDKSSNEELIGANISVVGTSRGASTDLDGTYSIKNVDPGKYSLRFSYTSYQTLLIENVIVESGKDVKINVQLEPAATELNEVVITSEALRSTEGSLLNIQKNSLNIVDGMSAELIGKNNSSDGTDILKRMTGITIADGKYAYVRGVGDRYNNTLLNGSNLPSTDPEKKSFSYDLFPASLIENILTSKTFTPDKPADFTGGLVEINTIEFPSKFILNVSVSSNFNSMTLGKNFVSYSGGKNDWLGFDDGTRDMPSLITKNKVGAGLYSTEELQQIGLQFKNNWSTKNSKAPIKGSFKINVGNNYDLGEESVLGYIASVTYSNSDEIKQMERNNYTFEGPRYQYNGFNYSNYVSLGVMFNTSLKYDMNNKISFKNVYNQNADDETIIYEGPYYYNPDYRKVTSLRFVSRSLLSSQLIGEHHLDLLHGLKMDWNLNYGISKRDEPDARRYVYTRSIDNPDQEFQFLLDQSISTRFFSDLTDHNYGSSFNFALKPFESAYLPNLKFGFNYDKKDRDFSARIFGFKNLPGGNFAYENSLMTQSVDKIFAAENFGNRFLEVVEITKPSDSYESEQDVIASYLMTEFEPIGSLRIVTGFRYEKSIQKMKTVDLVTGAVDVNSTYNDFLPSLNLTYLLTNQINVRLAYSRTLARPEFRELASFTYFDFVANELVQGNPNLRRSLITNYDFRFEVFPGAGELFAVSVFYKKFDSPIEQVLLSSSGFEPTRSFENSKEATSYGVEFELRKEMSFISKMLSNFSIVGNMSFIKSKIKLANANGFQASERPLQGQADYIANLGLYYEDYLGGFSMSVIYNKVGEKIYSVGFANLGDIIEKPREQVDINSSIRLVDNFSLKLAAKDLFEQEYKFVQRTQDGDKTAEISRRGRTFSAGLSLQF